MDEETPHIHIDFVPFIRNSKRGLDTRVSLKSALSEMGFKGGTRGATEWNQWIESEKKELAIVMERYGIEWLQKGTHNKHLSVLDYEKQERAKEVAELEIKKQEQMAEAVQWKKAVLNSKSELIDGLSQKIQAEEDIEKIKLERESTKKECDTLSLHNRFLKVENEELKEEKQQIEGNVKQLVQKKEDLQNDNEKLVWEQKKLEQELQSMADSKMVLERNVRAYDEDPKWQLPEPSAFMTVKSYRDNKAVPLVRELKELVKKLTIRCVNLMEQSKQLKTKVEKLTTDVIFYKDRLQEYGRKINELQQKADDLERVRNYVGNDKVDMIVENSKKLEKIGQKRKTHQYDYNFN